MNSELDEIKGAILKEHQTTGTIDRGAWLGRYPEHAAVLDAVFRLIDRAATMAALPPDVEPWTDPQGVLSKGRLNLLRLARIRADNPEEAALGAALTQALLAGGVVQPSARKEGAARELAPVVALGLVVQALSRAQARLHQFMGQKLTYLTDVGLRLQLFPRFAPHTYGMFDRSLYAVEDKAREQGWLDLVEKNYSPAQAMDTALGELVPQYIRSPELVRRYLDHLARQTNDDLEVWGMTHYAALQLARKNRPVTVPGIREVFGSIPEWAAKRWIGDSHVESALEHLVRLQLVADDAVEFVS